MAGVVGFDSTSNSELKAAWAGEAGINGEVSSSVAMIRLRSGTGANEPIIEDGFGGTPPSPSGGWLKFFSAGAPSFIGAEESVGCMSTEPAVGADWFTARTRGAEDGAGSAFGRSVPLLEVAAGRSAVSRGAGRMDCVLRCGLGCAFASGVATSTGVGSATGAGAIGDGFCGAAGASVDALVFALPFPAFEDLELLGVSELISAPVGLAASVFDESFFPTVPAGLGTGWGEAGAGLSEEPAKLGTKQTSVVILWSDAVGGSVALSAVPDSTEGAVGFVAFA